MNKTKEEIKNLFDEVIKLEMEHNTKEEHYTFKEYINFGLETEKTLNSFDILQAQPTRENPYIIESYPYGRLRTQKRWFIETDAKKGSRIIEQTLNPKTNVWNAEHKSTYSLIILAVIEKETGYIKGFHIDAYNYAWKNKEYVLAFWDVMNDAQKQQVLIMLAIWKNRTYYTITIQANPQRTEEEEAQHTQEQQETQETLKKAFCFDLYRMKQEA